MARFDISDREWSIIEPLLPTNTRGIARVDDRRVINGILWRWHTGTPWADIPERNESHKTCYNRFVRWRKAGAWANIPAMPQRRQKPIFSRHLYKQRNLVESFFNRIKHFRAIAT